MDRISNLHALGQSLWYDNIQRRLLESGELASLIAKGEIRGVTSNPSIFHQAIARSNDYDSALVPMAWSGWSAGQIFDQLAVEDIRAAADLFLPLYRETGGGDGYVSLEVNPVLANSTAETIREARRLFDLVQRPNLMVKIPATQAGVPAIRASIADGININVTLIFSLARYAEVMDAYLSGLEDRVAAGKPIDRIASVASFFVSWVDSKVDAALDQLVQAEDSQSALASSLRGKAAIANARLAYARFQEVFSSDRFQVLKNHGARLQRPLWASTSTKNPAYPDTLYVEGLIGQDTVNTLPPQTLDAYRDHGEAHVSLPGSAAEAEQVIQDLEKLGISMDQVTDELEKEGVQAFADAFHALLETIDQRRQAAAAELGPLQQAVSQRVEQLAGERAVERIHSGDASLWTEDPVGQAEIRKRLGWLNLPETSLALINEWEQFSAEVRGDGFSHALLLGMGGSSLAPEVLECIFKGSAELKAFPGVELSILDSTDPEQVLEAVERSPVDQTLYIVASKSGGTSEVNAFLSYFWDLAQQRLAERAGDHFVAITDPGTSLEKLAREKGFRRIFQADPSVGGRSSALSAFGLVPASLAGLDLARLLSQAQRIAKQCKADVPAGRNPGLVLGAIMGEAALLGRDKLTLLADPEWKPIGPWLEQLIAESSGKNGRGIVPIEGEEVGRVDTYGNDRLFVYLKGTGRLQSSMDALRQAGNPVLTLALQSPYEIGAEFFRWEFATAVACAVLGVNAFDQPDVQDSKNRTQRNIQVYTEHGTLDEGQADWIGAEGRVYGKLLPGVENASSLSEVIEIFLGLAREGDYLAINAYLPRNDQTLVQLHQIRHLLREKTHLATTVGFGPRFLHSTGQLHKGGADNGLFLQITRDLPADLPIPGQEVSFGILQRAQALGDLEALLARGRRAIRVHLTGANIQNLFT